MDHAKHLASSGGHATCHGRTGEVDGRQEREALDVFYLSNTVQVAVLGDDFTSSSILSFDSLNALDELHRCMKESLRIAPPLIMLMREVSGRI